MSSKIGAQRINIWTLSEYGPIHGTLFPYLSYPRGDENLTRIETEPYQLERKDTSVLRFVIINVSTHILSEIKDPCMSGRHLVYIEYGSCRTRDRDYPYVS